MLNDVMTVVKYEFLAMRRSSRMWLGALIYAGLGLIGGLVYIWVVRGIREGAIKFVSQQAGNAYTASHAVDTALGQAYPKVVFGLIRFMARCDPTVADVAACTDKSATLSSCDAMVCSMYGSLIDVSPILLAAFWGTLTFLPFFIVLLSFDQMSSDVQYRSVSYPLLRISRPALYIGKFTSHALLFVGLSLLLNTTLFFMGWLLLDGFNITAGLLFQLRTYALLIPFGLCYLALVSLWSSLTRSPFLSLLLSYASLFALFILNQFRRFSDVEGVWQHLSYIAYLSPSNWEWGLWNPNFVPLLTTVVAYLMFAAAFGGLGLWRFMQRDL